MLYGELRELSGASKGSELVRSVQAVYRQKLVPAGGRWAAVNRECAAAWVQNCDLFCRLVLARRSWQALLVPRAGALKAAFRQLLLEASE